MVKEDLMANCNYCGIKMVTVEHVKWGGYCKVCKDIEDKDKSRFDSPSSSEPKDIYSIWNGWTIMGWVFIGITFLMGDILGWIDFDNRFFVTQQIALTLAFGFIGIASIIIGVSKTILAVMKANNEKDKS